jgi:hypothetical protein
MLALLTRILTLLSILFFFNQVSDLNIAAQTPPQLKTDDGSAYTLPVGTVIRVRMDNGITSKSANVNDTFTTTVSAPVFVRSVEVVPIGTTIEGRIVKVGHAKRGGTEGFIAVAFETMKLPGGAVRKIAGELSDIDEESDPTDSDPQIIEGDGAAIENVTFIAGGAGAGAVVGGLTKGGSGAAIGGALGAGVGALASYFRKGEEAVIKPNAEIGVILKQSVTLPAQDY